MTEDFHNLHDETIKVARQAHKNCLALAAESIPSRVERIQRDLHDLVQAGWIMKGAARTLLAEGIERTDETEALALESMERGAALELLAITVSQALIPLTSERGGPVTNAHFQGWMKTLDVKWMEGFFVGMYSGRQDDAARLNAVFSMTPKPRQRKAKDNDGNSEGGSN